MAIKFKIGDSVFYAPIGSYGTISTIINAKDPTDMALQGPRYEVYFKSKGWTYSIPEKSLITKKGK